PGRAAPGSDRRGSRVLQPRRQSSIDGASGAVIECPRNKKTTGKLMMVLHHGWRSSASRRVRLCLEEKGLAYESHVVDMANMEHHSPDYLKINPLGVIPTLVHDGKPLHESGTICEYLDESFPDPPLRPQTPYERGEMRNWIRHIDGLIGNLIIFNWRHHLQKVAEKWSDEELAEKMKSIPSKERQEAWLRVARKPYTEEERQA